MKTNSAKISAEQFAERYPELFALYQELMLVTLETVDVRKALLTRECDDQVRAAQQTLEGEVAAAAAKYRENTGAFMAAYHDETRAAQDELNATLSRLLEGKDEASKPHNDAKQAELRSLEARKLAAQQCFYELKLFPLVQTVAGEFLEKAALIIERYDEVLAPISASYSDAVRRAFDKYNATVLRAGSVCNELCDLHVLTQKRSIRDATNKNREALLRASVDRDDRDSSLQAFVAHFKEERLLEIESFLHDPCEVTLRRYLTAAIQQMKERRDGWASALRS